MLGITSNIKILKKERKKQLAFIDKLFFQGQGQVSTPHWLPSLFQLTNAQFSMKFQLPSFLRTSSQQLSARKYINIAMGIRWRATTSICF